MPLSGEQLLEISAVLTPVGATATAITWLWLKYGRGRERVKEAPVVPCPFPEHVAELAKHGEAIETLKKGQEAIFQKLTTLPSDIAAATAAATGVAIATALHRK